MQEGKDNLKRYMIISTLIYPYIYNSSILQFFKAIDNMNATLQKKLEIALKPSHLVGYI